MRKSYTELNSPQVFALLFAGIKNDCYYNTMIKYHKIIYGRYIHIYFYNHIIIWEWWKEYYFNILLTFIWISFKNKMYFYDGKAGFSAVITPVFSVTWSFRNLSNMLISCSKKNIYIYYHKNIIIINVENVEDAFFWLQFYRAAFIWSWNLMRFDNVSLFLILIYCVLAIYLSI